MAMTDDHHDNSYEDTGEITSVRAHIAYADWRGPDFDPWWGDLVVADAERERQARQLDKREAEEFQSIIDDYFALQVAACTTRPDCKCGRHPANERTP